MKNLLVPVSTLVIAAAAAGQAGRTMNLLAPAFLGQTASFQMTHPTGAAGNLYAFLYSAPFPGSTPIVLPGFAVNGAALVDPVHFIAGWTGVLNSSGSVVNNFTIPAHPFWLGLSFDLQSLDLDFLTNSLTFAGNELNVVVTAGLGTIEIASATTTSLLLGNNNLQSITDATIGAPVGHGLSTFAYLPTCNRGEEGYVEGFAASLTNTPHNSDIDSLSRFRVSRRTANGAYQVLACPNGYDVSIVRSTSLTNRFSILSYERATGTPREIPGSSWLDTGPSPAVQQTFYMGISKDGQWGALIQNDSNAVTVRNDRIIAFRTDGLSPAIDISSRAPVVAAYYDGTIAYTNDFLLVGGSSGWMYTSATAPTSLVPLPFPNTTASNLPNAVVFFYSARITRDGSAAYLPISGTFAAFRQEMDMVKVTNNAGVPLVSNYTQFAVPTGIAEFGLNGVTPSNLTSSGVGLKASVSPDGNKIAFVAATPNDTVWPGIYVADGTANPPLHTVAGANIYSEVTFLNNDTVMFFAGTAVSATDQSTALYRLDVPTGTITQVSTATNIRTRGNCFSRNKDWWYFLRSTTASMQNDIVAVECATGAVHDVTGAEFGGGGLVGSLRTGSFNTTTDPWLAVSMQLRRAPVGNYAYFTARKETGVAGVFEDANVFRFDMENGGPAVQLTNNTTRGALTAIKQIESLTISDDGNHIAWAQRTNTVSNVSENVFQMNLTTNTIVQSSVTAPAGQTITDGSIVFTGGATPTGVCWSIGTGSTTVPTVNARVEWAALGSSTPTVISAPAAGTRLYQVLGTHL
ncbi:MAG: hypothetical protein IT456_02770 [Planctomycetes bacterium]|nr:hypothetical protein [Planctomycetota bacterium]